MSLVPAAAPSQAKQPVACHPDRGVAIGSSSDTREDHAHCY
jgi:hypothetical protein